MIKKIKIWLKSKKLKNTLKRTKCRLYLWRRIRGEIPVSLYYGRSSVSVARPEESYLVNHATIFNLGIVFKSSPSGKFLSDESVSASSIQLTEEDKEKGWQNPFEKEERQELEELGYILSVDQRRRKDLIKKIDWVEDLYFRDF